MALVEVKVPDIGDFDEVAVIELLVKVGDTVKAEQSLITVESDKASMEIPSSTAGVVKEMRVALGDKVKEGSVVLVVEAASGKAQDVVTALESYKQDQVAFYGNYAEFAQAQSNVENAIISSKGDRVVMVIASNACTADLNSAVDSALNS